MASEIEEKKPLDLDEEKNESFEENKQNGDENPEISEDQVKLNENHDLSDDVITIDDPNPVDNFSLKLDDTNPDVEETEQKNHENDIIEVNDDFLSEVDKIFEKPIKDDKDEENGKLEKEVVPIKDLSKMELIHRMKQLINERFLYVMKIVNATNVSKVEKFFELEELMTETWFDMGKFRKQTTKFNKDLLRKERNTSDIKVEENDLVATRLDKFKHYLKSKEEWVKNNGPRPKTQRVRSKLKQNIKSNNKNIEKTSEKTDTKVPQNNEKSKKEPPSVNKEEPKKNSDSLPKKDQKDKLETKRNGRSNDRSQRFRPLKRKFDSKPSYDRYRNRVSTYDPKPKKTNPWSPLKQEPTNFASSLYENAQKMVQEQLSQALMKNVVNNVVNNVVKGMVQKMPIMPKETHFSGNQSKNNRRNKVDKQPSTPWLKSQRHDYSRDEIPKPNPWISAPPNRPDPYSATSSRTSDYLKSSSYKFGSERSDMMLEPFANFSSLSGPSNSGDFGRKRDLTDRGIDRAMEEDRMKRMRFEYRSDGSRYHN